MLCVKAKLKPKWFQFRWRLSNFLLKLVDKIQPKNPDVYAFYLQAMMDQIIYGKHVVRINPADYHKEPNHVNNHLGGLE